MSNVFIDFAGIFHVKDDLFRFIDTMEDHQKVLIFTINSENDFNTEATIDKKTEFTPSKPQEFKNF